MNLLSKIFGGSGSEKKNEVETFIENKMQTLLDKSGIKLSFDIKVSEDGKKILLDLYGEDEAMAKDRDAQLLDGFQLFLKRALQHSFPEEKASIIVDCDSYREQADDELYELAEKLKGLVIKKKKAVYFRALPPRERKLVHQYFSEDKRFKTKSVGEGVYKKIKIFLINSNKPKANANNGGGQNKSNKKNFKEKNNNQFMDDETLDNKVNGNIAAPDDNYVDDDFSDEENFNS